MPEQTVNGPDTLFDGPLLPEQDAAVGRKPNPERYTAIGKPKPSKKHKKKAKSLRDMAFETSQAAQTVMRDEMARGVHQPQKLGEVLDEVVGSVSDGIVATEALAIINQYSQGLQTGMREWSIIQSLVEQAYKQGYRDGARWTEIAHR